MLKSARIWLVWKFMPARVPGGKPVKLPFYLNGKPRGDTDTLEDRAQLVSYEDAIAYCQRSGGVYFPGFALGFVPEWGLYVQGFDSDGSMEGADTAPGYVERSPSGTGYHVIGIGRGFRSKVGSGEEWYSAHRFFSYSGEKISDGPVVDLYDRAGTGPLVEHTGDVAQRVETLTAEQMADLKSALSSLDPDPYEEWAKVALALQSVRGGRELFLEWSRGSAKHKDNEANRKFDNVGEAHGNWRSIFVWAQSNGWENPARSRDEEPGPEVPFDLSQLREVLDERIVEPRFVLDDFIDTDLVNISGAPGVGKTTIIVPLALAATHLAHIPGLPLPERRRNVLYISENPRQVRSIVQGLIKGGLMSRHGPDRPEDFKSGILDEINARFNLVKLPRQPAAKLARWLQNAVVQAGNVRQTHPAGEFEHAPLVVIDTVAANIEIKDENDNAEMSKAIAAFKDNLPGIPIILVSHVAKASYDGRAEKMTGRGAGAQEGDVQQTLTIAREEGKEDEPDRTVIYIRKDRFDPPFRWRYVETEVIEEDYIGELGTPKTMRYRFLSELKSVTSQEHAVTRQEAKERRREENENGDFVIMSSRIKSQTTTTSMAIKLPQIGVGSGNTRSRPAPEGYTVISYRDFAPGRKENRPGLFMRWLDSAQHRLSEDGCYALFDQTC